MTTKDRPKLQKFLNKEFFGFILKGNFINWI